MFVLSDTMLVVWNWFCWENLHYRNQQILKINSFFPQRSHLLADHWLTLDCYSKNIFLFFYWIIRESLEHNNYLHRSELYELSDAFPDTVSFEHYNHLWDRQMKSYHSLYKGGAEFRDVPGEWGMKLGLETHAVVSYSSQFHRNQLDFPRNIV